MASLAFLTYGDRPEAGTPVIANPGGTGLLTLSTIAIDGVSYAVSGMGMGSGDGVSTGLTFTKVGTVVTATVTRSGGLDDLTGSFNVFSGDYNDLSNKPTIPAAQVNADWNAASGIAQILNKPTIPATLLNLTDIPDAYGAVGTVLAVNATRTGFNFVAQTGGGTGDDAFDWATVGNMDAIPDAKIPDLDAAKITSGTFGFQRLPTPLLGVITAATFEGQNLHLVQLDGTSVNEAITPEHLGTGTPSMDNFLRGDGTWAVPSGTGGTPAPLSNIVQSVTTLGSADVNITASNTPTAVGTFTIPQAGDTDYDELDELLITVDGTGFIEQGDVEGQSLFQFSYTLRQFYNLPNIADISTFVHSSSNAIQRYCQNLLWYNFGWGRHATNRIYLCNFHGSAAGRDAAPVTVELKKTRGAAATFIGLTDTPSAFGTTGQFLRVNATGNGLEFVSVTPGGGGDDAFDWATVGNTDLIPLAKIPVLTRDKLAPGGTGGQALHQDAMGNLEWAAPSGLNLMEVIAQINMSMQSLTLTDQQVGVNFQISLEHGTSGLMQHALITPDDTSFLLRQVNNLLAPYANNKVLIGGASQPGWEEVDEILKNVIGFENDRALIAQGTNVVWGSPKDGRLVFPNPVGVLRAPTAADWDLTYSFSKVTGFTGHVWQRVKRELVAAHSATATWSTPIADQTYLGTGTVGSTTNLRYRTLHHSDSQVQSPEHYDLYYNFGSGWKVYDGTGANLSWQGISDGHPYLVASRIVGGGLHTSQAEALAYITQVGQRALYTVPGQGNNADTHVLATTTAFTPGAPTHYEYDWEDLPGGTMGPGIEDISDLKYVVVPATGMEPRKAVVGIDISYLSGLDVIKTLGTWPYFLQDADVVNAAKTGNTDVWPNSKLPNYIDGWAATKPLNFDTSTRILTALLARADGTTVPANTGALPAWITLSDVADEAETGNTNPWPAAKVPNAVSGFSAGSPFTYNTTSRKLRLSFQRLTGLDVAAESVALPAWLDSAAVEDWAEVANSTTRIPMAKLGANPVATKILYGDGTWGDPPGGMTGGLNAAQVRALIADWAEFDNTTDVPVGKIPDLNAVKITEGVLAPARLATNTPSATTVLYGNETWAVPAFLGLGDTPSAFGTAGQILAVNSTADGLVFINAPTGGMGSATWLGLTDTPNAFGTAGQFPVVNSATNALEWGDLPSKDFEAVGAGSTDIQSTFVRVSLDGAGTAKPPNGRIVSFQFQGTIPNTQNNSNPFLINYNNALSSSEQRVFLTGSNGTVRQMVVGDVIRLNVYGLRWGGFNWVLMYTNYQVQTGQDVGSLVEPFALLANPSTKIQAAKLPDHSANLITSDVFDAARIPDLPFSKITGTATAAQLASGGTTGQFLQRSGGVLRWATPTGGMGSATWLGLSDTPGTFGTTGQLVQVNASADGLEFVDKPTIPAAAASWALATGATGTAPVARLGTGTPSATVFLRGDGTWATPAGGGGGGLHRGISSSDITYTNNYTLAIANQTDIASGDVIIFQFNPGAFTGTNDRLQVGLTGHSQDGGPGEKDWVPGGSHVFVKVQQATSVSLRDAVLSDFVRYNIYYLYRAGNFWHVVGGTRPVPLPLTDVDARIATWARVTSPSGVAPTARLGTGTASTSTFLRGDGTWAAPPGGGTGDDAFDWATEGNTSTIPDAKIPNLNTSKITAGVMATARLGTGTASASTYLRGDSTWAGLSGPGSARHLGSSEVAVANDTQVALTVSGFTDTVGSSVFFEWFDSGGVGAPDSQVVTIALNGGSAVPVHIYQRDTLVTMKKLHIVRYGLYTFTREAARWVVTQGAGSNAPSIWTLGANTDLIPTAKLGSSGAADRYLKWGSSGATWESVSVGAGAIIEVSPGTALPTPTSSNELKFVAAGAGSSRLLYHQHITAAAGLSVTYAQFDTTRLRALTNQMENYEGTVANQAAVQTMIDAGTTSDGDTWYSSADREFLRIVSGVLEAYTPGDLIRENYQTKAEADLAVRSASLNVASDAIGTLVAYGARNAEVVYQVTAYTAATGASRSWEPIDQDLRDTVAGLMLGSGGLTQAEVDARIALPARVGNTDLWATSKLGAGTAGSHNFLRGDGTWVNAIVSNGNNHALTIGGATATTRTALLIQSPGTSTANPIAMEGIRVGQSHAYLELRAGIGNVTSQPGFAFGPGTAQADVLFYRESTGRLRTNVGLQVAELRVDSTGRATSRTQLGLGTAATADTGTTSGDIPVLDSNGRIALARLGSGTPGNSNYLRGDGQWETPSTGSSVTLADAAPPDIAEDGAVGTSTNVARQDHTHELPIDNTLHWDSSDQLAVQISDIIEHLQQNIQYWTSSTNYNTNGSTSCEVFTTGPHTTTVSKIEVEQDPPAGAHNFRARIFRVDSNDTIQEVLGQSGLVNVGSGSAGHHTYRMDGLGVEIPKNSRIAVGISRIGEGSNADTLVRQGTEHTNSPNKSYTDADKDFDFVHSVEYAAEDPGVNTARKWQGNVTHGSIKIYYDLKYEHAALVGTGNVDASHIDSESATDGQILTADGSGNAAWEDAPASGEAPLRVYTSGVTYGGTANSIVEIADSGYTPATGDIVVFQHNTGTASNYNATNTVRLDVAGEGTVNLIYDRDGSGGLDQIRMNELSRYEWMGCMKAGSNWHLIFRTLQGVTDRIASWARASGASGTIPDARIPSLNASKITAGTITRPIQPGSGEEVTKFTFSDNTPSLSDMQDGEIWFEY